MKDKNHNKEKNRIVFRLLISLFILLVLSAVALKTSGSDVRADDYETREYTEEEKAQAKAWLSAHGYPPTRAGAQMAYQDYLNGKFDNDPDVQRYLGKEVKITEAVTNDSPSPGQSEKAVETHPPVTTSKKIWVTTGAVLEKTTEETTASSESFLNTDNDAALKEKAPAPMKKSLGFIFIAVGILAGIGIVIYVRR